MLGPPDVTRILALQEKGWGTKRIAEEHLAHGCVATISAGISRTVAQEAARTQAELPWLKERFLAVLGNVRVLPRDVSTRCIAVA